LITWSDFRPPDGTTDLYAQRIDDDGNLAWNPAGFPVCTAVENQWSQVIIPDGEGGAIIVWHDYRPMAPDTTDIYGQRLDAFGHPCWTDNGVLICGASGMQAGPEMIPDGAGGAIIIWLDSRGTDQHIYAQRIDAEGTSLWLTDGVEVSPMAGYQSTPAIASDGAGGAIVTWTDLRGGDRDIYAQRLRSGEGARLWGNEGVLICGANDTQYRPELVSDDAGYAIILWEDDRTYNNRSIYAQRVDPLGGTEWADNGLLVSGAIGSQSYPLPVTDMLGGVIAVWRDRRADENDLYAQRISPSGAFFWHTDGIPICDVIGDLYKTSLVSDGSGGAIITWEDRRESTPGLSLDIYAQRVDDLGMGLWDEDGLLVCGADGSQYFPELIADPQGNAIITWYDFRARGGQVYAQYVSADGGLGPSAVGPEPVSTSLSLDTSGPNPFSKQTAIRLNLPTPGGVNLGVFSIDGRRLATLERGTLASGTHVFDWDGRDQSGRRVPDGIYFVRLASGAGAVRLRVVLVR